MDSILKESLKRIHFPVLLREVLQALQPIKGKIIVDGTFGAGGYTEALLRQGARVIAFDRDEAVVPIVKAMQEKYGENLVFHQGTFSKMTEYCQEPVDGIVLDLGVSTMQLQSARGFSFRIDGKLDMRMGNERSKTVADFVNTSTQQAIADVLWRYGEEVQSRRIAKAIVEKRQEKAIQTSIELAKIIHQAIGSRKGKIDSATQTFQALRLQVNQELEELEKALQEAPSILKKDGVLAVVSFHSLEDRIIKHFFQKGIKSTQGYNRHLPPQQQSMEKILWQHVEKKQRPKADEVDINPSSRSAILRVGIAC